MNDQMQILREACLAVAGAETSCNSSSYDATKSPLHGHSEAVASLIQVLFGGDIITGKVNEDQHYWNRLPDGKEIDLTSCQFGGDGYTPLRHGKKMKPKKEINLRFMAFAGLVKEKLAARRK